MKKFRSSITTCLAVLVAGLACGVEQGSSAQTPADVKSQVLVKSKPHAPPAYQRRQEAKKRFKEALEARKAQRLSGVMLPDKIAPNKGVQNEKAK